MVITMERGASHADKECRSRLENFNLRSKSNSVEDTMEDTVKEGEDPLELH